MFTIHFDVEKILLIIFFLQAWAAYYVFRLATKSPEVTWAHHSNQGK